MLFISRVNSSAFLLWSCLLHLNLLVAGHSIGRRELRKRGPSAPSVEIVGLDVLNTYVCPPCANVLKRQTAVTRASTIISVPLNELQALYQDIEVILQQLAAFLSENGIDVSLPSSLATSAATSVTQVPSTTPDVVLQAKVAVSSAAAILSNASGPGDEQLIVTTPYVEESAAATLPAGSPATSVGDALISAELVSAVSTGNQAQTAAASSVPAPAQAITTMSNMVAASTNALVTSTPTVAAPISSADPTIAAQSSSPMAVAAQSSTVPGPAASTSAADDGSDDACEATTTIQSTSTIQRRVTVAFSNTQSSDGSAPTVNGGSVAADVFLGAATTPDSQAATSAVSMAISANPSETAFNTSYLSMIVPTVTSIATTVPHAMATTASQATQQVSADGYVFNSQSRTNIAVYFGQTAATSGSSLVAQCADANIDIVILAFIISNQYDDTPYPLINFGAACGGQTSLMASEAPGLLYCPDLASQISQCQSQYGKKVLLSIGGAASALSFTSATQASDFANILWQLFGPAGSIDIALRPFGAVSVDGFDIDNEDNMPANFDVLGSTLRTNFASDGTKSYYLTSAPQCPFPDASDPMTLLLVCDFVFVQFYNNAGCEIGSTGFNASLVQWSTALEASALTIKPRLYLGTPAWSQAGPSAYAHIGSAEGMQAVAQETEDLGLPNFGGVMFWDGPEGMLNTEDGKDIIAWAKSGLTA